MGGDEAFKARETTSRSSKLGVGIGADPRFNNSTTHQQNPNYQPF
jgi:hypothetical protein